MEFLYIEGTSKRSSKMEASEDYSSSFTLRGMDFFPIPSEDG